MKTLNYTAPHANDPASKTNEKAGVILRELERLVCQYDYLVPNGWRFILEMVSDGEVYWGIDIQGNKGGGTYAEAKMETLKKFPNYDATGDIPLREILGHFLRNAKLVPSDGVADALRCYPDDSDMLSESQWEDLRSNGYAPCHGGIRIPYEDMIADGTEITTETGEIRFAFSGASEEQDVFFALSVFKALNKAFLTLYPNTQGWLDLRKLRAIPEVQFWLDRLEISEA